MKLRPFIVWLISLALVASVIALYLDNRKKAGQLATVEVQLRELVTKLAELEQEKNTVAQAQQEEIERLRKDNQELLRLRNEVRQLRDEKDQLAHQAQLAQTQVQRAQAQVAAAQLQLDALRTNVLPQQTAPQASRRPLPEQVQLAQLQQCINNLRILDGAKQMWALENRKPATAVPTQQELLPYLGETGFPTCPAGGVYTLNQVNVPPTCSIPGHALE